jgi:hypothetical protein
VHHGGLLAVPTDAMLQGSLPAATIQLAASATLRTDGWLTR